MNFINFVEKLLIEGTRVKWRCEFSNEPVTVLGAAYAGEGEVERVKVSLDNGTSWRPARFIGPREKFAWRQWQFIWEAKQKGDFRIMARGTDADGQMQPMNASWNVLGYGNNGVQELAVLVHIV